MGQRVFFALNINDETRGQIVSAADGLRSTPGRISWTKAKNLHVTMNFIGDVPDKRIPELCDLAKAVVDGWDSGDEEMVFTIGQLMFFPPGRRAKMIWAPVRQGGGLLVSLHDALNEALDAGGWRSESRPFTGHVTVARIKEADIKDTAERLPDEDLGTVQLDELTLYQSQLTQTGPIYSRLAGIPLVPQA
jgi:2'-5' RNA ligase